MADKTPLPIGTLLLATILAVAMIGTYLLVKPKSPPAELEGVLKSEFRPLAPFQLQVHGRAPITEKSLRGKWSLFFFGYTSCPDVCPNTLYELGRFYKQLEAEDAAAIDDLQVVFVSVDPDRDDTAKLASYVAHFEKRFIGATAGKGAIERLARQFGAAYEFEPANAQGQYLVAHSSAIFLVDPYGRLIAAFSQPHYAATLVSLYQKINAYYGGGA